MQATMGGNLINYPDDVGVSTANLLLIKIFLNSVISMKGAKFANADLANFYLMSLLKRPEYAKIKLSDIPEEVIIEYKLNQLATPDGLVYVKVTRAMYGLPQAATRKTFEPRGILSKSNCVRIMEAQNQNNPVCPGGR